MDTPADHNESLHELELGVRTELTLVTGGRGRSDADEVPVTDSLTAEDELRYEVSLHVLLGAIEAVEADPAPTSVPL